MTYFDKLVNRSSFLYNLNYFFGKFAKNDTYVLATLITLGDSNLSLEESNTGDTEHTEPLLTNASSMQDDRFVGKFVSKNVVNISSKDLSESEISLLSKGLTFSPTPRDINISEIKDDLEVFGRKLRLKWHFREEEEVFSNNPLKKKIKI